MITKLYAMGIKGLDFTEENLTARTVFTGSVGAGKSARGQALWLLATGTVPGMKNGKTASDILDGLGNGGTLSVGADIDGQTFDRVFTRTKGGSVTQNLFMNGKKVPKGAFDAAMLHAMQLCDVAAFLSASDTKQIEAILALIPGEEAGRIRELDQQEGKLKIDLGNATHTVKGLEASVASMARGRAEIATPSATLPEIKAEIARLEGELSEIDQQIGEERARIEAERKAAEDETNRQQQQASMLDMLASPEQPATVKPLSRQIVEIGTPDATFKVPENEIRENGIKIVSPGGDCDLEDLNPGDTFQFAPTPYHNGETVNEAPYGYCPQCGAPGATRERCPDGNDVCQRGHTYPSRLAMSKLPGTSNEAYGPAIPYGMEFEAKPPKTTTRPQAEGWHPQGFVKVSDLKRVLEVMDKAGCTACAAKMVLKKLIREAS